MGNLDADANPTNVGGLNVVIGNLAEEERPTVNGLSGSYASSDCLDPANVNTGRDEDGPCGCELPHSRFIFPSRFLKPSDIFFSSPSFRFL